MFIKRVRDSRGADGHGLLLQSIGRKIAGTPQVLGHASYGRSHFYFFENLHPSFVLLDKQLAAGADVIAPEVVRAIVVQAAQTFAAIARHGYVYIDFCTKNIMRDATSGRISIIDMDSAWAAARLRTEAPSAGAGIEFWGLWNEVLRYATQCKTANAPKSVVLSFAAVWARATMLIQSSQKKGKIPALNLVLNPNFDRQQRALWTALREQNRPIFIEYFGLNEPEGARVYAQWQRMLEDMEHGRELPWREVVSASDNLLRAIGCAQPPRVGAAKSASVSRSPATRGIRPSVPKQQVSSYASPAPAKVLLKATAKPALAVPTTPASALQIASWQQSLSARYLKAIAAGLLKPTDVFFPRKK